MSAPYPRHPNAVILPSAIHVSPLIRFSRYVALGLGIVWGAFRLMRLKEYHADIREWEHEKAVIKAKDDARKKKWAMREETAALMKFLDLPFEEGKVQLGMEHIYRDD